MSSINMGALMMPGSVVDDLDFSVPQITFKDFLEFLAPPQPTFNLELTMKSLEKGILSSGRWSAFEQGPKYQQKTEDAVFLPIGDIFNEVVDAIIANSELTTTSMLVKFLHRPTLPPRSSASRNVTRPDGYLVLKERAQEKNISWADISLSCEYKRNDGEADLYDDVSKCIWNLQHIMRDDPSRRAAFAMTIENVNTRLWFCCRSAVIVSEPFDFISQPELLVKLFAAFAFADMPSLGFDPTMERVPGQPTQFNITVHPNQHQEKPRRFQTKRIISSSGAEPLRGRGTRVFEAVEIDEDGHEIGVNVVLKDIWIDKDRTREGIILAQLYDEAQGDDKALVRKYFLTTLCHGDVLLEGEVPDDTEESIMRGLKTTDSMFSLGSVKDLSKTSSSTGSQSVHAMDLLNYRVPRKYAHKAHYRIVFEEQGIMIHHVTLFHDVLKTLMDTVDALRLLRRLGWVHRDLSVGNILRYQGGAKLVDLEYAKKTAGSVTCHNMRMGTLHFMPVEVVEQDYLFLPVVDTDISETLDLLTEIESETLMAKSTVPWTHNYLHDLEALWWVATWIVANHCFSMPNDSHSDLCETPESLRVALFPPTLMNSRRQNCFIHGFSKIAAVPQTHKQVFLALEGLRRSLTQQYRKIQSMLPRSINLDTSDNMIYKVFKDIFKSLELSPNYTLISIPQLHAEITNSKREREDLTTKDSGPSSKRRAVE